MWDTSVPKIHLAMRLDCLKDAPVYPLPEGISWRFFQPGDETHWAGIEVSAGEFPDVETALKRFRREFPVDNDLDQRMIFLTDGGEPFATATAWFEDDETGHLHYVAIDSEHQGKGLSRPLVSLALCRMQELGHTSAILTTQTYSWVAIAVYHHFGFRTHPVPENDGDGWRIVSQKTGIHFELT